MWGELAKKKFGITNGYPLVVSVLVSVFFIICMVVMMKWAEEKDNVLTSSLVSFVPSVSELLFIFLYKLVTLLSHVSSGGASEDEKPNV